MTHPTFGDGRLYCCLLCAWRAVRTTDQRLIVTEAGDNQAEHRADVAIRLGPPPLPESAQQWLETLEW